VCVLVFICTGTQVNIVFDVTLSVYPVSRALDYIASLKISGRSRTLSGTKRGTFRHNCFFAGHFVRQHINTNRNKTRAANYCRTSDNVRLNLANVRAKVILIGHWSDHKKNCRISDYTLFCCDKIRLQIHSICILQ
jgi:hypothetical protein